MCGPAEYRELTRRGGGARRARGVRRSPMEPVPRAVSFYVPMQTSSPRWLDAEREHAESVAAFLLAASYVPDEKWHLPLGPGRWSPAEFVLHIERSYALGREAVLSGASMRPRASRPVAWLARNFLLPLMTRTRRFPRGAKAPREVVPDAEAARGIDREALAVRLQASAADALRELRTRGEDGKPCFSHAYFGPLSAYQTLRMLSAHTRHHATHLAPPRLRGKDQPCLPETAGVEA